MSNESPVVERVRSLLAPVVASADAELLDVEWTGDTLRLVVDAPDDRRGITTETLTAVNRLVSPLLDQHDPVPGRYTLEVSSPGVERPLRRPEHYRRAVGEDVVIKLVPEAEPRRLRGALRSVDGDEVTVEVVEIDGVELDEPEQRTIELGLVTTARTVFDWGPAPKPGGKKRRSKGGKRHPSKHN